MAVCHHDPRVAVACRAATPRAPQTWWHPFGLGRRMDKTFTRRGPEPEWSGRVACLLVLAGAAFGLAMVGRLKGLLSDEAFHGPQIWDFYSGKWAVRSSITMIPSYHLVQALVAKGIGVYGDPYLRVVTLVVGLCAPLFAWNLARVTVPEQAARRTVQTLFFPLLFPFLFLIYTDTWCVAALLATFFFTLRRRLVLAGICGLVAMALRQDSVLWVAFAWLLAALDRETTQAWWRTLVASGVKRAWPLLVALAAFVGFVCLNRGVAVGDRSAHQAGFNVTNLYSLLIWSWVLFLPQNVHAVPRIARLIRARPWVLVLVAVGLALYMFTYANTHPYNGAHMRGWVHNELLYWMGKSTALRAAFFVPMAWMALTFAVTPLVQRRFLWLYPVGALYACMHPLIEPRYYLASLLLFQIWRKPAGAAWEDGITGYGIVLSILVLYLVTAKITFL